MARRRVYMSDTPKQGGDSRLAEPAINDRAIDQAFSELRRTCGGLREDYFGLLYLEEKFGLKRDIAVAQIAFGGNDYGVDGFHFELDKRNLYLFQFKWSESPNLFKPSFERLINAGMERVFAAQTQDQHQNQLLLNIKSCIMENESVIDHVFILFVFKGDAEEAERSTALDRLREDLENKKYLIDQRFGRQVTMVIEFRSARTHHVGKISHEKKTRTYPVKLDDIVTRLGPNGEKMTVGFVRLNDLYKIYKDMGQRFFEKNIRAAKPEDEPVNRSIQRSIKNIVLTGTEDPRNFAFNHNGVTLYAEALTAKQGQFTITEPRVLNGAQTITTFARFIKSNEGNNSLDQGRERLGDISVMCRVITDAKPEFVTTVTVNNNRQNPVEPWNLRANDMIQLEIQDKFREDLGIYYERQESAFKNLSDEDLEILGIKHYKAIELTRLARTYLVSDGDIDKLDRFRDVFEDEKIYNQTFGRNRLRADSRKVVLCYKAQFRLPRLANDILEMGVNKYYYIHKAKYLLWALICQAILNDRDLERLASNFGETLSLEAQYTEYLSNLATSRCRFIISHAVLDDQYAARVREEKFGFLRTNAVYKRCMEYAYDRYRWTQRRLC